MTLETIFQIFSGNTESAFKTRNSPVHVQLPDGSVYAIEDVTLLTNGDPILIASQVPELDWRPLWETKHGDHLPK